MVIYTFIPCDKKGWGVGMIKKTKPTKPKKDLTNRILFQLDGLTKLDLKRASLKKDLGNVSHMINSALKFYIKCVNDNDRGLEKFLAEKLQEAEAKLEK